MTDASIDVGAFATLADTVVAASVVPPTDAAASGAPSTLAATVVAASVVRPTVPPAVAVPLMLRRMPPLVASDAAPGEGMGALRWAMALKVKYRITQPDGKFKTSLSWDMCGIHEDNRGGVYPSGETIKNLCVQVCTMGVNADEADHMGIAVQARPQSRAFDDYNKKQVKGNPILEPCFPDHITVRVAVRSSATHTGAWSRKLFAEKRSGISKPSHYQMGER